MGRFTLLVQQNYNTQKHIGWACTFSEALKPYSSNAYLVNFLGDEGQDLVRATFGTNYERLAELKTKYDPTNFFSLNQNVAPRRNHPAGGA
jgi:hypothetical protein